MDADVDRVGGALELALSETIAPDVWNAERAPRVAHPAWTVAPTAIVRRYAVPVDDASVVALGAVDVVCAAPARASVLFGDRLVWAGVVPQSGSGSRLTCGGINLLRARAKARDVHILVAAPADADVRVTATVRLKRGDRAAAAYESRGLFTMDW